MLRHLARQQTRRYRVLALELSCDDSCVALFERVHGSTRLVEEVRETLNSTAVGGVIPTAAHNFHQERIARLTQQLCAKHNVSAANPPGLICVTRGPGMVGSISAGLQFAKGLAVAWDRPLVGVHHMLGHLLVAGLPPVEGDFAPPQYPFLSLLCSGGHTLLALLTSLAEHEVIINTADIAAGDAIDKCARELDLRGNMLGPELEKFVRNIDPQRIERFRKVNTRDPNNAYRFSLSTPFRSTKHAKIPDVVQFGFASFPSSIAGYKAREPWDDEKRELVAFKTQELVFDHIVDRINVALTKHGQDGGKLAAVKDFVCSGGVAANGVLRQKLSQNLKAPFRFHFPPLKLCTDNATMIGHAGIEIFEHLRLKSSLDILPIRRWPMNELTQVDGWERVGDAEYAKACK